MATKLWYVYQAPKGSPLSLAIVGTVEAQAETTNHPVFKGAKQKAEDKYGPGCDVVSAGDTCCPRRGNLPSTQQGFINTVANILRG